LGQSGGGFRRDIEGLRAVAILAVVLYHAHVGLVRGGFTGVDDFFVISGFLITSMLWGELIGRSRISFREFYARRIRRLLPASFLVLAATAVASAVLLSPLDAVATLKDGLYSALYVGNYHFIALQTNYLTVRSVVSPFQQYWSLGVEEQFYVVWPLLLLGASQVWRRRALRGGAEGRTAAVPSKASAVSGLAVIAAGSFALNVWLTQHDEPWAFFSLPTRAWELAVGGLVAFAAPWLARHLRASSAALLGWGGLAVVVGAALAISPDVAYPGLPALAPVLGTAAVLAAGSARAPTTTSHHATLLRGPELILGWTVMQVLGRVSYSWYLWHWPVLILAPSVVGHQLSLAENLLAALVSLALALLTFVALENPVRRSQWLRLISWRTFALGGALTGSALAICTLASAGLPSLEGQGHAPVAHINTAAGPPAGAATASASPTTDPASAPPVLGLSAARQVNPYQAQLFNETQQVQAQVAQSVNLNTVPANLQPSLAAAETDEPVVFTDGCLDSYLTTTLGNCDFGDTASPTTVMLFGDSHASMWFPAVDNAATHFGWNLLVYTKTTCPPLDIPVISPVLGREYTECGIWRQNVLLKIEQARPALVILGVARHYDTQYGFTVYSPQWIAGLRQMVTTIESYGSRVAVFGPVPKVPYAPPCLSAHLDDVTWCRQPLHNVINQLGEVAEDLTTTKAGGYYIDVQPWFCTTITCPMIIGNLEVFRDDNHITATYANFLTPLVENSLALAVGSR
jgi:peptidoglycan/LPS O-acetylase OafA/YrhL